MSGCTHRWEPTHGSAWGTILGVSRCLDCGTVARREHFACYQPEPVTGEGAEEKKEKDLKGSSGSPLSPVTDTEAS